MDSLNYNAHSTAVELLWCWVPVVSVAGQGMAGRVAASVLLALDAAPLLARTPHDLEVSVSSATGISVVVGANQGRAI